ILRSLQSVPVGRIGAWIEADRGLFSPVYAESRLASAGRVCWGQPSPRTPTVSSQYPQSPLSREAVVGELQVHGLKPTGQRILVAEILMGTPTHMTAEQILAAVRSSGERVSKATVYNTLKALANRGLVRQIHLDPERSVYDSTR